MITLDSDISEESELKEPTTKENRKEMNLLFELPEENINKRLEAAKFNGDFESVQRRISDIMEAPNLKEIFEEYDDILNATQNKAGIDIYGLPIDNLSKFLNFKYRNLLISMSK